MSIRSTPPIIYGAQHTDHPRTVTTPERRAALEDHVADYLANAGRAYVATNGIVMRDAIEHGWQGATADIAEKLEAIVRDAVVVDDALFAVIVLTDELKREVGA